VISGGTARGRGYTAAMDAALHGFNVTTLFIAAIVVVSVLSTIFSFRAGAPILLVFLGVGFLAGEDGIGRIAFDDAEAAFKIGSIALALILFDSGFSTPLRSFKAAAAPAVTLATVGVLLTSLLVALAAHWLLPLDWGQSLLLGAILASTDAAAVFFLLRAGGIHLRDRVRSLLEIESGSNDPVAIFLTLALVGLLQAADDGAGWAAAVLMFVKQMGLGLLFGWVGGHVVRNALNRLQLEAGLYPVLVAALAIVGFALTNLAGGSGFLAVYVAGLLAASKRIRHVNELKRFQQGLSWLAQIAMFVTLGLLATPSEFPAVLVPGLLLGLFLALVARPLVVWLCLLPFRMSWQESSFVGFVGLRGAVSILLAILPLMAALPDARLLFNLAFIVVLVSLVVQGWGLGPLARALHLIVPERLGAIDRIQLDLPDAAAHELVAYRLTADSPLIRERQMPRWVRPALVVRDGKSIRSMRAERLRAGDVIYLFVRPHRIALLDRLVASRRAPDRNDREFFGDFAVDLDSPVVEVAAFYGGEINPDKRALSVRHFLEREFGESVEVGDRVGLGTIELIVREVDDDRRITEAGLSVMRKA
jgi:cell volume regulation protein A